MKPPVDPGIYLLADHLDAALAAGEDLLAAELAAPADIDRAEPGSSAHATAVFVNDLKRLEAALAARILQARRRAAQLPRQDPLVRGVIDLFESSTSSALALVEHFSRLHDGTTFDPSYLTPFAVLRSRGLLAPDAAELPPFERVAVTEAYLIGGVLRLGEILNVVASTLDTLDNHFDLYLDNAARAAGAHLEKAETILHDPAELLQAAVETDTATAPPDAAAAASPDIASVNDAEANTKVRPESDSVSTATSVSSGTPVSPIEAAPVTSSAEPVSVSSNSVQASASTKLAASTSSTAEASGAPNMPTATKAPDPAATGASSADASPQATSELANATGPVVRAAGNAKELAAVTVGAPRKDAIQELAVDASATTETRAAGELKINFTAPSEKSAAAATATGEQKKADPSPDAAPVNLAPLTDDKAPGQSAPAEAKSSSIKADKSADKPTRAAEAAQPKPAKKPMTLLEALAALDKNRPPTFPSG